MINSKRLSFLFAIVLSLSGTVPIFAAETAPPKNIILFIGDGIGVSQITAGKIVMGNLNLEQFKTVGLLTTHSQSDLVTDSAAAGTALATGFKTYNGAISVSQDQKPFKTIVEYAEEKYKATGIVVSCSVTHATPASFVAHVDSRNKNDVIAEQITKSGIDVLFGGGLEFFLPKSAAGSTRSDEKNLLAELQQRMKVVRTAAEFAELDNVDAAAGFFSTQHPLKAKSRKPRLSDLTRKAIKILSRNKNGFFLMVEGSQIDRAGHQNNPDDVIAEVVDFDAAVGVGLDFAKNDTRTLVVVTSDHETGGFAVHDGSVKDKRVTASGFTSRKHTAAMVPVFACGPGSAVFSGIGDNTFVGAKMIEYMQTPNTSRAPAK